MLSKQSCLPDQHAAKIDLLNSYLTKYSVPSDTTFPKPKKSAPPPSSSPPKPSSSAASSSRRPFSSSQSEVISIDSGTESDDSDVVCLTPIIKKTPVKKAPFKPKSTPVKAKPLVSSPAKTNRVLSPQSSQDVKPNIAALSDPLLPNPKNVIEKMGKQIPRALLSLSTDAPKTRVPSRSAQIVQLNANGIIITQGMINAELKFATIKLEMMRVYIAYAVKEGATALQSDWRASKADILSKALRGHRYLFESVEGDLPTDLQEWQRREQAVLDALF